jgi:nucleotide-binding universal stress UspA family protein
MHDLDRCGQAALASGVATHRVLLQGDPPDEIVREARRTAADIVVMGRHSKGASNPSLLGSVAERVLRKAPCPVMVVRSFPRHPGEGPRRVLCGLDLGETSSSTLKCAVVITNALRADLRVLHVVADGETQRARLAVAATLAIEPTTTGLHIPTSVAVGVPYEEILAVAHEKEADLIVVGTHGGGVVDRQFLGSTTLHLLRQAECPVLVVPAHVSQGKRRREAPDAAPVSAGRP